MKRVLMLIVLVNFNKAIYYNKRNSTGSFNFFKQKYHKSYKNYTLEDTALKNFVKNLNKIDTLNNKIVNSDTILVVNKHSDLDTDDVGGHFGLSVSPFDNETLHKRPPMPSDTLRTKIEIKNTDDNDVEAEYLYDLYDADNIYKKYMKQFKKKNATTKYGQTVQYYRFLKTLVELNRQHYKGDEKRQLDENSNIVKRPFEYIY